MRTSGRALLRLFTDPRKPAVYIELTSADIASSLLPDDMAGQGGPNAIRPA